MGIFAENPQKLNRLLRLATFQQSNVALGSSVRLELGQGFLSQEVPNVEPVASFFDYQSLHFHFDLLVSVGDSLT